MGRKKTFTDVVLEEYYKEILRAIKANGGWSYSDALSEVTGLNRSQIGKALQYARRKFDNHQLLIQDYVMANSTGYFLPTRGREVVAYVAQNYKDIRSRARTQQPIFRYAMEHWEEELLEALKDDVVDEDVINDEMEPWAVFNKIMNR